jgi:hypothetical protein
MEYKPTTRRWIAAVALAVTSLSGALMYAAGDLRRCQILVPTALAANVIVAGGPDGSGHPTLWIATFILVTVAFWSAVWYGILVMLTPLMSRALRRG